MFEKIMLSTIIIFFCTKTATSQPENLATEQELKIWIDADKADTRAKTNDIVYSISATVSDSDKERFEKWIKDVLYSALYKSDNPMKKAQLKATRWLEPLNANADSTW
ncbi:MAG: hypothetical protein KDC53_06835, partial [Saprospiraceae bacterium]|nr:hypothetical protein [Saprospiraceae bacterium]